MDISDTILESNRGNVKIIRFNKPKRKNAIDIDMFARVTGIINEAANDPNVYMVVLTGTGDFYSSGRDLASVQHEDTVKFMKALSDFIRAFILFPKLMTAIVNGPAVGIATTTLPLCDFVFASDKAYFYTPFTKLGIIPEGCSTITFPRLIGARKKKVINGIMTCCAKMAGKIILKKEKAGNGTMSLGRLREQLDRFWATIIGISIVTSIMIYLCKTIKATKLLLLNYKMPAQEALECGLIDCMFKSDELAEKAWCKIDEILALPIESFVTTKRLFRRPHLDELLKVNERELAEVTRIAAKLRSRL